MSKNDPISPKYTRAETFLIVPRAHTALLDTRFQIEMYELFHRTWGGRIGHIVGTPMILFGTFLGLQSATGSPVAGTIVLLAMSAFALRVDRLVAALTALLGAVLVGVAAQIAPAALGAAGLSVAALVVGGCALQTLSHAFEDVPPPHSGTTEFVPVGRWLRERPLIEFVRSGIMVVAVFYWLELWATFRIWPLQILQILTWLGYRSDLREQLDARSAEIVADPTSDWRTPMARR